MVADLNIQGMIPGQDTGKVANKKEKLIQNLELINLIQDAIGQGVVTKQGKFSDVLGSLKQTQAQSVPIAPQKYADKTKVCSKVQPSVKNSYAYSSTPIKKAPLKELSSFKEKQNQSPQISNKINATVPSRNQNNVLSKNNESNIEIVLDREYLSTINITNALEYDFLTTNNSQGSAIPSDNKVPSLIFKDTSIQKVDSQLRNQLDQWISEGKVQIQKLNSPLEKEHPISINFQDLKGGEKVEEGTMTKQLPNQIQEAVLRSEPQCNQVQEAVLRSEPHRNQIQEVVLRSEPQRNQIQEVVLRSEPQHNQVQEPSLKVDRNPGETQISIKTSSQQSQPLQESILASSQKEISSTAPEKIAADESIVLATKSTDNIKTIEPILTQAIPTAPATKSIDNSMDRPLIQKTNSLELEEVDSGKIGLGQNQILQNPSEKVGGKTGVINKSFTMAEKIQALQQVKSEMKVALQKGETHLLVKLTPDDLGKVDIKLDISKDGTVSAFFRAENRETMVLLSKYADDFRQIFGDSGLTSDMSGMNFSSSDHQASQFDQVAKLIGKNVPILGEQEEISSLVKINADMNLGLSPNQRLNITV